MLARWSDWDPHEVWARREERWLSHRVRGLASVSWVGDCRGYALLAQLRSKAVSSGRVHTLRGLHVRHLDQDVLREVIVVF